MYYFLRFYSNEYFWRWAPGSVSNAFLFNTAQLESPGYFLQLNTIC